MIILEQCMNYLRGFQKMILQKNIRQLLKLKKMTQRVKL